MINVDEEDFLIATDIDKLIDILSTKKDVDVGKISKELKMKRKEVEKWLHVLEEEGVVNLVHRMGALHAVWVMDEQPTPAPQRRTRQSTEPKIPEIEIQETEVSAEFDEPVDLTAEIGEMAPVSAPKKSLFSGIFKGEKSKKKAKKKKEAPKLKLEDPPEEIGEDLIEEEYIQPLRKQPKVQETVAPLLPVVKYGEPAPPMKKKLEKSKFLKLHPRQTGELRKRLDDYLHLIRDGKEELKVLESEKERIHREGFLSLEKEFEASLDNLEYALLEKEKRILEAKERVSRLPEKVDEIDQMQQALQTFDSEAGTLLSTTKEGLDTGWKNLQEASEELSTELAKGEEEAMRDRSRMMQLRDMLQSMGNAEEQLKETLESGRITLEDMEEKVRTVEESLDDLVDSRAILTERVDTIHTSLERRMRNLDALQTELERIEKIEGWFKEYSEDYAEKMDEITEYVGQSEEELLRIKKAAEIEYVRKYLKELSAVEDKYREDMGALEMEESSVDENITDVRLRIKQLMTESTELMAKYRAMSEEGTEFEETVATAKESGRRHRVSLDEKANQRKKLLEDAKRLKRSKPSSKKGGKKKK